MSKIRYIPLVVFISYCLFQLFAYYKIKVDGLAYFNEKCYVKYEKRFGSEMYILRGTLTDTDLRNEFNINGYYIIENKLYVYVDYNSKYNKRYYEVNLDSLRVMELSGDKVLNINDKKTKIEELDFKSLYWYIIFN